MAKLNKTTRGTFQEKTHEGATADRMNDLQALRRAVMSCLLWEDTFYEDGVSIADRITSLAEKVSPERVAEVAVEARHSFKLRHAPLLLLCSLAKTSAGTGLLGDTIPHVVGRPDELSELVSIYWRNGKRPLSAQMKKGLAKAFNKFDAYQLAKYNRETAVRLRDVLFLCHAKPKSEAQAETWKRLVDGTLPPPDTWEVALSGGADKKETFTRLLEEGRLGYMALLRNLRNMSQAGVSRTLIKAALMRENGPEKVFPYRFLSAWKEAPEFAQDLDKAFRLSAARNVPMLPGVTAVVVDISGSMTWPLSNKSKMCRMEAAATLAAMVNAEDILLYSFSNGVAKVPFSQSLFLGEAITNSQENQGTYLGNSLNQLRNEIGGQVDRTIIITDEQAGASQQLQQSWLYYGSGPDAPIQYYNLGDVYVINVASYQNGVSYRPDVTHIDGFSEHSLSFIAAVEGLLDEYNFENGRAES